MARALVGGGKAKDKPNKQKRRIESMAAGEEIQKKKKKKTFQKMRRLHPASNR